MSLAHLKQAIADDDTGALIRYVHLHAQARKEGKRIEMELGKS